MKNNHRDGHIKTKWKQGNEGLLVALYTRFITHVSNDKFRYNM